MKTITINKIDDESYTKLMEFLNTDSKKKGVILDSQGGSKEYGHLMGRQLENHRKNVTLIVGPGAYSAAFSLFHDYQGDKMMVTGARGMRHKAYSVVTLNDDGTPTYFEDRVIIKNGLKTKSLPYERMTDKEKRKFNKGKDVYFDFERMQEIFPDAKIIK